jgi:hypothetical protein
MKKMEDLLALRKRHLIKALDRLSFSYEKVKNLPLQADNFDDQTLEVWESFSARFARASDIFLSQYLRTLVLLNDKGFQGSMRDFLNEGEKIGIIDNAESWMNIRELRNVFAHEYTEDELANVFRRLLDECPRLLKLKSVLNAP